MNFQDQDTQQEGKNPFNANVLKGGKVDPRSKLYQRSIAGREKLDEMLQRLWDQGADEADVFMAGVRALTSRDKGYVGAYLDSKNPGRRYQDNEAKAITDQVMSNLGIGEHPGARLTRPKDGEGKEERKTSNQMRGAFGPGRPEGEAPSKAMPVGQQRKQGKRSSTGQALEDSRRPSQEEERQKRAEGKQDYYYTGTNVQREFMDFMKDGTREIQGRVDSGQITPEQAVEEMSKLKDQALTKAGVEGNEVRRDKGDLTPKEQEQADKKKQRQDEMRQRIAEQKGLRDREAAAGPEPEEASLTAEQIGEILDKQLGFIASLNRIRRAKEEKTFTPETINQAINELSDYLAPEEEDPEKNKQIRLLVSDFISKEYSQLKRSGWRPEQPAAAPEPKAAAAPEPSAAGTKEPDAGKLPEKEINDNFLDAFGDYLFDPDSGKTTKTNVNGYIRDVAKNYGVSTQDIVSSIMKDENGARALKRAGFGATSLVRKGDTSPPESEPSPAAAPKPEAPTTAPTEGAAAPEPAAPAAGPSKEEAPTPRKVTSKGGFKAPSQQGRKKGGGGGFGGARAAAPEIMKAGKEAPSLEDFKTYLYNTQGELFGKKGFETGGSDNPMEDQGPDQFEKWRGEPAEPRPGAQEGGREPATAGKGQEGQGSLLKKGTEFTKEPKARGDFKKGQKPPAQKTPSQPSPDTEPASKYNTQPSLFGKRGFDTGGSDNPLEDKAPDPYAKYRGEPTEPRPGAQEGGREPVTAGRGQEGQGSLLKKGTEFEKKPEARGDFRRGQKPKPEREGSQKPQAETPPSSSPKKPSTGNERAARLKELIDSGMSSSRALSQMRKEGSIKPKAAKKGKGKISNNAEYQEFAQSIRSMMR